jgi:hypothetical protein
LPWGMGLPGEQVRPSIVICIRRHGERARVRCDIGAAGSSAATRTRVYGREHVRCGWLTSLDVGARAESERPAEPGWIQSGPARLERRAVSSLKRPPALQTLGGAASFARRGARRGPRCLRRALGSVKQPVLPRASADRAVALCACLLPPGSSSFGTCWHPSARAHGRRRWAAPGAPRPREKPQPRAHSPRAPRY